jgi:hypothetical protein
LPPDEREGHVLKAVEDLERALANGATVTGITVSTNPVKSAVELNLAGEQLTWEVEFPVALHALALMAKARAPVKYRRQLR